LTEAARPKILVVDDAGPVVILCVNVLQALGYAIRAANRGEAAIELVRKEPFDLRGFLIRRDRRSQTCLGRNEKQRFQLRSCQLRQSRGAPGVQVRS